MSKIVKSATTKLAERLFLVCIITIPCCYVIALFVVPICKHFDIMWPIYVIGAIRMLALIGLLCFAVYAVGYIIWLLLKYKANLWDWIIGIVVIFGISIVPIMYLKSNTNKHKADDTIYYISLGKDARVFHEDRDCYGLRNSKKVISVTWEEAVDKYHRRPCKWCFDKEYFDYPNYGD